MHAGPIVCHVILCMYRMYIPGMHAWYHVTSASLILTMDMWLCVISPSLLPIPVDSSQTRNEIYFFNCLLIRETAIQRFGCNLIKPFSRLLNQPTPLPLMPPPLPIFHKLITAYWMCHNKSRVCV